MIIRGLAYDGRVNIILIDSTNICEEARRIHDLSPVCTAALGRLLTITALMGCQMKSKSDKLTIQIKGNGPIGTMLAVSNNIPQVKATISNPTVDMPLNEFGKLDVSGAVGTSGFINVVKDIGLKEPYIGVSPIISGEIGEDFANYFANSEQTNSAVALGVLVNQNGVKKAGGYIITPMPDATEEDISKLEKAIFEAGAVSKMLESNFSLEEIAKRVTLDKNIKFIEKNDKSEYKCDCSQERMEKALATINPKEIEELKKENGFIEMQCHFCNKKYKIQ